LQFHESNRSEKIASFSFLLIDDLHLDVQNTVSKIKNFAELQSYADGKTENRLRILNL